MGITPSGRAGPTRTGDQRLRRSLLYPTELQPQVASIVPQARASWQTDKGGHAVPDKGGHAVPDKGGHAVPDKGVPRDTRLPDRTGGPCGRPTRQNNSDGILASDTGNVANYSCTPTRVGTLSAGVAKHCSARSSAPRISTSPVLTRLPRSPASGTACTKMV